MPDATKRRGRPRTHASNAARQRDYRQRLKSRRIVGSADAPWRPPPSLREHDGTLQWMLDAAAASWWVPSVRRGDGCHLADGTFIHPAWYAWLDALYRAAAEREGTPGGSQPARRGIPGLVGATSGPDIIS